GATPKQASAILIRDSIRAALIPTVDSAKTVGLVSLPGMMSGLIFAGIDPVKAIKYQIGATPKQASAILIRDSIRAALIPTVDSAKTVGL
ncbi:ABC transporter permease, partial [Enterobacter hormaechei]|uniref:ABC transporter permease n=1 Tax=Enterobacter hormaechei TaxID=158836 RepID=UPI00197A8B5E